MKWVYYEKKKTFINLNDIKKITHHAEESGTYHVKFCCQDKSDYTVVCKDHKTGEEILNRLQRFLRDSEQSMMDIAEKECA